MTASVALPRISHLPEPGSTRDRLLRATLMCLRRTGNTKISIAEVSREAGISRQTIYSHFSERMTLVHAAVELAAVELAQDITLQTQNIDDPTNAIVEAVASFCLAARRDPVIRMIAEVSLLPELAGSGNISAATLELSRMTIIDRLHRVPGALDRADEITETILRFLLSVVSFTSDLTADEAALRRYLNRYLGGALGLRPPIAPVT